MSIALSSAVNGLNASVARTTQSVQSIVNASSTGGNLDGALVRINSEKTNYAANAAVIREEEKRQKTLIDIIA